ncbi:lipase maturation factor 2-like isoform X2 [Lineus longissimus]|uniref:lipase maturation factor 2-like isoform X2 n=1 Tax=Lineus longissimus TaxID=88925 RepID=UPI002B4FB36D
MGTNPLTKDLFLWFMSVIYLFAFASLYVQIPGLYGDNGILPAKLVIKDEPKNTEAFFKEQASLLRLMPFLNLDVQTGMDLLCVLGILVSFLCFVHRGSRDMLSFSILWILYYSLFQVGQTFLWFQWDILLLETGFLCILVAPLQLRLLWYQTSAYNNHDTITMYLVKWLLFRLMFASGVVKLTSQCQTWWGLTALNWHFESQCLPTPLAWFYHQMPEWFLRLSTVITFVIEMIIPFLFFAPIRSMRFFAFYAQILLQVLIILTGNYNFFNLLTMALCISLLDDGFLLACSYKRSPKSETSTLESIPYLGFILRMFKKFFMISTYVYIIINTIRHFNLKVNREDYAIESKIAFTKDDFNKFLEKVVPFTIYIGAIGLGVEIIQAVLRCWREDGMLKKLWSFCGCVVFGFAAAGMFALSLVPYSYIEAKTYHSLSPSVVNWYEKTERFEITSHYGLFRSMTGVGGRPEVVFEGSNSMKSGWKEYEFLYKPGNVSRKLPIVAPHQPRLDWQMWFASLGSYQENLWFVNLAYRILTGQPEVMELIDHNPFPEKPPKFLRAHLYHYHFTSIDPSHKKHSRTDWWWREKKGEYLPILTKDEPTLLNYLRHQKIFGGKPTKPPGENFLAKYIHLLRDHLGQMEGFNFVISLFLAGLVVRYMMSIIW